MSLYKKARDVKRSGRDAKWYISIRREGRVVQVCTGTSDRDKARMIEAQILDGLMGYSADRVAENVKRILGGSKSASSPLLADVPSIVEQMLESVALEPRGKKRRVAILSRLAEWAHCHHVKRVSDVSVQRAWEYAQSLEGKTKTKQNIVGELSASWTMLRRAGYATENPWTDARPRSQPAETKSGTAFTADEVRRILDESRCFVQTSVTGEVDCGARREPRTTWLTIAIMIAVYTGLRQNDVFGLKWSDIDLKNGLFVVTPSKTKRFKRVVRIPIHLALLDFLKGLEREGEMIVPNPPTHPNKAWNLCLTRAGVVRPDNELTTFHSLRHTYATLVRAAGADKGEQMLLGGWTNVATANRYDHAADRLRSIVDRMPTIG